MLRRDEAPLLRRDARGHEHPAAARCRLHFLNERLAEHYGIPGVHGSYFRRVAIAARQSARGLLGQGSILTLTSVTSRTSPVIRGRWVLETLLGSPAPNPPPNVNTTLEGDDGAAAATSVRERLEAHRRNPDLRVLSRDHGPDRLLARELRPDRRLAGHRGRPPDRHARDADRRHGRGRPGRAFAPPCSRAPTRSSRRRPRNC